MAAETNLYVSLCQVAVQLGLLGDVHGFGPDKLQQGDGDARVPRADPGLRFHQVSPAALQVGGWRAVQGHVGQLVIEHAVVLGLNVVTLAFGHQALRDQLVRVRIWDTLPRSSKIGEDSSYYGLVLHSVATTTNSNCYIYYSLIYLYLIIIYYIRNVV